MRAGEEGERWRLILTWAVLLLCLLGILGCVHSSAEVPDPEAALVPTEEQRLIVYTSHKENIYKPLIEEFEIRSGIWVDVVTGGTAELLDRIREEASAPKADVMFGGGADSLLAYGDCFSPFHCGEEAQILEQYQTGEGLWTPFSALPVVLIANPKLLEADRVTDWPDLFDPQLRGRIAFADPTVSGSSYTALLTVLAAMQGEAREDESLRREELSPLYRFARQVGADQLDSSGAVLQEVAAGRKAIGVTLEEMALSQINQGANLRMIYPASGTSCVPDGTALVKDAPHEENAKQFIAFTLSRDVQQWIRSHNRRSVRRDVPQPEGLPALEVLDAAFHLKLQGAERERLLMSWSFYAGDGEEAE